MSIYKSCDILFKDGTTDTVDPIYEEDITEEKLEDGTPFLRVPNPGHAYEYPLELVAGYNIIEVNDEDDTRTVIYTKRYE